MEILGRDGANFPILPLLRQSRDALARYCEARWPIGRRKAVEREWNLSPDEARGVIEATASAATIDKVWKAGGWAVALPVLSSVIGLLAGVNLLAKGLLVLADALADTLEGLR